MPQVLCGYASPPPPATDGLSHTQRRRGVLAIPERTREGKMGWPHCTFSCEGLV